MLQTLQFEDRLLTCSDCDKEFVFTAGEQFFFHDKQFKNDPKRCKPCKSRRSGLSAVANGTGPAAAGLSRTETRTECSECGIQTTVPFKPTQGRPVLCRGCFQVKNKSIKPAGVEMPLPLAAQPTAYAIAEAAGQAQTISALTMASIGSDGAHLSAEAATLAAASMAGAHQNSSVATAADLALIAQMEAGPALPATGVPIQLLAAHPEIQPAQLAAAELSLDEPAEA